jgi:hydrogenase maturation protein HypF
MLLKRREGNTIAEDVAPRQSTLGVMLAYTPLHHLLMADTGIPLVMTSGNNSDEPIAYRDEEVFGQIGEIADYFLVHDRPIHIRTDDSVVRFAGGKKYPIRRSRGYAPSPLRVAENFGRHVLACGGELKNTFCLAKERHVFLSHHIGDMENYETLRSFREGVEHLCRLFDVSPELVAYDLHPEYPWQTTSGQAKNASPGWPWTGPATVPTGPSGVGSSSREACRADSSGGDICSTLPCPVDRRPSGSLGGWP